MAIALLVVAACSKHPKPPVTWSGVALTNDCMLAAIKACGELKGTGANERVLLIKYGNEGTIYGHAETYFEWPPKPSPYCVSYLFDENHGSFPLPQKLDTSDPLAVARFAIPQTTLAWWTTPNTAPTTK